ncbi:MAG: pyruvate kinase [Woeseiaceae bacterium]|jgi:pyruvate kinase|nr:pyruvate kinase [Woeseiaceae bacterium]
MSQSVRYNKTKIIATMGPATSDIDMIKKIIIAGVDVCRINFSHGDWDTHLDIVKKIRQVNEELGTHVAILGDLQGPKLRIGEVEDNKMLLQKGKIMKLTTKATVSKDNIIYVKYSTLARDVKVGERVLLDDGKLELEFVNRIDSETVEAKVINGGYLSSNKGFNLPSSSLSVDSLTTKDKKDLEFIMKHDFDWVALSFVREADDIHRLRKILQEHQCEARIIAKIEKPQAVYNIDEIIKATNAIMVARGDLGVEMPMEEVPMIQKRIVSKCIQASKPVIIATQMMESMIESPTPTRAEANDVANAVMDGADAVMLSAETSVGKYALKAVEAVEKILGSTEEGWDIYNKIKKPNHSSPSFLSERICYATVSMSEGIKAKAILSMTQTGYTAYKIASGRPNCDVFIFTANKKLLTRLSLVWNVRAYYYDSKTNTDDTIKEVISILQKDNLLKLGDVVINTAAMPVSENRKTNALKISVVE